MSVRKVSNRGGNIIGRFPSLKLGRMVEFESLIERDFIYLLDFESEVALFSEQPLTIEYEHEGKGYHYTPDFWLIKGGQQMLVECKPVKMVDMPANQRKFTAARAWCAAKKWDFQVVTDEQLRRGYRLTNIRFLTQFARYHIPSDVKGHIRACLGSVSIPVTIADLMGKVNLVPANLVKIPIYHMAFHHELVLNLDEAPISLNTPVSLGGRLR
jgi:hypothetical protein